MTTAFTIGDLSKASGVPTRTIRFYESKGLLPCSQRSDGGYRLYAGEDLRRLALIRRTRALGFSLTDVRRLLRAAEHQACSSYQGELARSLTTRLAEVDQLLEQLALTRADLAGALESVSREEWGDCQQTALQCCTDEACLGT